MVVVGGLLLILKRRVRFNGCGGCLFAVATEADNLPLIGACEDGTVCGGEIPYDAVGLDAPRRAAVCDVECLDGVLASDDDLFPDSNH